MKCTSERLMHYKDKDDVIHIRKIQIYVVKSDEDVIESNSDSNTGKSDT